MAESHDLQLLSHSRKLDATSLPPGRGFTQKKQELQCMTIAQDEQEERAQIAARARELADRDSRRAPGVRTLPDEIRLSTLTAPDPESLIVGVRESDLVATTLQLSSGHFLIAGRPKTGKSQALGVLVDQIPETLRLHLIALRRSPLVSEGRWASVATTSEQAAELVNSLLASLGDSLADVLVIDDIEELREAPFGSQLEKLLRRGRDGSMRCLAAGESTALLRSTWEAWSSELRKDRSGLLLAPDPELDGDLLGAKLPGRQRAFPAGRGYLIRSSEAELVQVALRG